MEREEVLAGRYSGLLIRHRADKRLIRVLPPLVINRNHPVVLAVGIVLTCLLSTPQHQLEDR